MKGASHPLLTCLAFDQDQQFGGGGTGMAHLVVRGLMQMGGVDFFDTFSPTPIPPSIMTVASESQIVNDVFIHFA